MSTPSRRPSAEAYPSAALRVDPRVEVCALQASPLLGAYLGGLGLRRERRGRLALLLLGSLALTAHVFVFNDWAGYDTDARDARRAGLRRHRP